MCLYFVNIFYVCKYFLHWERKIDWGQTSLKSVYRKTQCLYHVNILSSFDTRTDLHVLTSEWKGEGSYLACLLADTNISPYKYFFLFRHTHWPPRLDVWGKKGKQLLGVLARCRLEWPPLLPPMLRKPIENVFSWECVLFRIQCSQWNGPPCCHPC